MSPDPFSRRFDPRRRLPTIGTDGAALFEEPDVAPLFEAEESTGKPAGWDVDEALEQIASEGSCVCPLCGAIVADDGSVLG
jgi:hypothetical protein